MVLTARILQLLQLPFLRVVGLKKDLHRLFSFYWFLDWERQRSRSGMDVSGS